MQTFYDKINVMQLLLFLLFEVVLVGFSSCNGESDVTVEQNTFHRGNHARILNTDADNQASPPALRRTFPKCCSFNFGIALDTETQLMGCHPHTLLDSILEQKYRQFNFAHNPNCQMDTRNTREIDEHDFEEIIDRDPRIQAGNGFCIDEEVKFGVTHLIYC